MLPEVGIFIINHRIANGKPRIHYPPEQYFTTFLKEIEATLSHKNPKVKAGSRDRQPVVR